MDNICRYCIYSGAQYVLYVAVGITYNLNKKGKEYSRKLEYWPGLEPGSACTHYWDRPQWYAPFPNFIYLIGEKDTYCGLHGIRSDLILVMLLRLAVSPVAKPCHPMSDYVMSAHCF